MVSPWMNGAGQQGLIPRGEHLLMAPATPSTRALCDEQVLNWHTCRPFLLAASTAKTSVVATALPASAGKARNHGPAACWAHRISDWFSPSSERIVQSDRSSSGGFWSLTSFVVADCCRWGHSIVARQSFLLPIPHCDLCRDILIVILFSRNLLVMCFPEFLSRLDRSSRRKWYTRVLAAWRS